MRGRLAKLQGFQAGAVLACQGIHAKDISRHRDPEEPIRSDGHRGNGGTLQVLDLPQAPVNDVDVVKPAFLWMGDATDIPSVSRHRNDVADAAVFEVCAGRQYFVVASVNLDEGQTALVTGQNVLPVRCDAHRREVGPRVRSISSFTNPFHVFVARQ